jgi:hypothetical protein
MCWGIYLGAQQLLEYSSKKVYLVLWQKYVTFYAKRPLELNLSHLAVPAVAHCQSQ